MGALQTLRRASYMFGRILGDVIAITRGPGAMARRWLIRKPLYRLFGRIAR